MRKIYILPNLFTAGSLFCGVLAIFEAIQGNLSAACVMLVASGFLDTFDGAVARLTHSTSAFGLNFDSLSDLVAFGVAPSVLAFQTMELLGAEPNRLTTAVCCLFVICGAMRLARYNVQSSSEESKRFTGLPIPAAAGAIVSLAWVADAQPLLATDWYFVKIIPPAMVVVAYLMVSNLPFAGLKTMAVGRQPFEILVVFVAFACLVYLLRDYMYYLLLFLSYIYLVLSITLGLLTRRSHQDHDAVGDLDEFHGNGQV